MILVFLVPKIKETHHAAEPFAPPGLLQFQVDIAGAAAKHMEFVEEVVSPPFMHHRFQIALIDSHFARNDITEPAQILPHVVLAFDRTRVDDVGVGWGRYGFGDVHFF